MKSIFKSAFIFSCLFASVSAQAKFFVASKPDVTPEIESVIKTNSVPAFAFSKNNITSVCKNVKNSMFVNVHHTKSKQAKTIDAICSGILIQDTTFKDDTFYLNKNDIFKTCEKMEELYKRYLESDNFNGDKLQHSVDLTISCVNNIIEYQKVVHVDIEFQNTVDIEYLKDNNDKETP